MNQKDIARIIDLYDCNILTKGEVISIFKRFIPDDNEDIKNEKMFFASYFIEKRKASGLNLRQLQKATGISISTLCRLETGNFKNINNKNIHILKEFYENLPSKRED